MADEAVVRIVLDDASSGQSSAEMMGGSGGGDYNRFRTADVYVERKIVDPISRVVNKLTSAFSGTGSIFSGAKDAMLRAMGFSITEKEKGKDTLDHILEGVKDIVNSADNIDQNTRNISNQLTEISTSIESGFSSVLAELRQSNTHLLVIENANRASTEALLGGTDRDVRNMSLTKQQVESNLMPAASPDEESLDSTVEISKGIKDIPGSKSLKQKILEKIGKVSENLEDTAELLGTSIYDVIKGAMNYALDRVESDSSLLQEFKKKYYEDRVEENKMAGDLSSSSTAEPAEHDPTSDWIPGKGWVSKKDQVAKLGILPEGVEQGGVGSSFETDVLKNLEKIIELMTPTSQEESTGGSRGTLEDFSRMLEQAFSNIYSESRNPSKAPDTQLIPGKKTGFDPGVTSTSTSDEVDDSYNLYNYISDNPEEDLIPPAPEPPNKTSTRGVSKKTGRRHDKRGTGGQFAPNDPETKIDPNTGEQLASGGMVGNHPGGPRGTDTVPAWLTEGEVVVPKSMVEGGAVDHLRGKIPGFSRGGYVNYLQGGGSVNYLDVGGAAVLGGLLASGAKSAAMWAAGAGTDPSKSIQAFGSTASLAGKALSSILPIAGAVVEGAGQLAQAFGALTSEIDRTVERYGEYSPEISMAQAQAEIAQTMGDISRAQRYGNELAEYANVRSEMQQSFEEAKMKMLKLILPAVTLTSEMIVELVKLMDGLFAIQRSAADLDDEMVKWLEEIFGKMPNKEPAAMFDDPTELILKSDEFGDKFKTWDD